jgi:hypothetical protein
MPFYVVKRPSLAPILETIRVELRMPTSQEDAQFICAYASSKKADHIAHSVAEMVPSIQYLPPQVSKLTLLSRDRPLSVDTELYAGDV